MKHLKVFEDGVCITDNGKYTLNDKEINYSALEMLQKEYSIQFIIKENYINGELIHCYYTYE